MNRWKKTESQKEMGKVTDRRMGESARGDREGEIVFFFSSFLSKIYRNQFIGFLRSKRQSWSMYRELRMGTKILEFHHTP